MRLFLRKRIYCWDLLALQKLKNKVSTFSYCAKSEDHHPKISRGFSFRDPKGLSVTLTSLAFWLSSSTNSAHADLEPSGGTQYLRTHGNTTATAYTLKTLGWEHDVLPICPHCSIYGTGAQCFGHLWKSLLIGRHKVYGTTRLPQTLS